MFQIGDKVTVQLQKIDPRTKHRDAPATVVDIPDPMHIYLVEFTPHLPMGDGWDNAWIVQGRLTSDLLVGA
ncbi:MAG: hypothetical protein WD359_02605 [Dehalococcoidia bacterium]